MLTQWKPIAYIISLWSSIVSPIPTPPTDSRDILDYVDPMIGVDGPDPNHSGGMVPSVGPPFAMTRWVPQSRENYVSVTPYNVTDTHITGFQATHQPAIWMGESGQFVVVPGVSGMGREVKVGIEERGMRKIQGSEKSRVDWYEVEMEADNGVVVKAEMTATSRVGHLRFTFTPPSSSSSSSSSPPLYTPTLLIQSSRTYILRNPASPSFNTTPPYPTPLSSLTDPSNLAHPEGSVQINPLMLTMAGHNEERQDDILTPVSNRQTADGFKAWYYAKFDASSSPSSNSKPNPTEPPLTFASWGTASSLTLTPRTLSHTGPDCAGYVVFPATSSPFTVDLRVGVSFISMAQAARNVRGEIPDRTTLENTRERVGDAWRSGVGRVRVGLGDPGSGSGEESDPESETTQDVSGGGTGSQVVDQEGEEMKKVLLTAVSRTMQYPYEQHEDSVGDAGLKYWSGYTGRVESGESYTGYSIWDTYRASWAWQLLFVPDRIPGMVKSMLQDYAQSGWLPMWKNIVETNIMIATHADSLIAEAVVKGFAHTFNTSLALEAVLKDCEVAPIGDDKWEYADREEGVDYEVRAGLDSVYKQKGWVADDLHSESASRTLGYSYDDYAASVLLTSLSTPLQNPTLRNLSSALLARSLSHRQLYNPTTGFIEARNADGTWAGPDRGWTEGDKWAYTFDVVHDVEWLIGVKGGKRNFVEFLDVFFGEGHSDHSNEPSHHIPYLYALAGAASRTQKLVREVSKENYNASANGLSGNEDCGQMSAWYIFSAVGFYPVNPVSGTYVIGSPFFPHISLTLPSASQPLTILAPGARTKPYVKSVTVNGVPLVEPVLRHEMIRDGAVIRFEMSEVEERWGSETVWGKGSGSEEGVAKDEL